MTAPPAARHGLGAAYPGAVEEARQHAARVAAVEEARAGGRDAAGGSGAPWAAEEEARAAGAGAEAAEARGLRLLRRTCYRLGTISVAQARHRARAH